MHSSSNLCFPRAVIGGPRLSHQIRSNELSPADIRDAFARAAMRPLYFNAYRSLAPFNLSSGPNILIVQRSPHLARHIPNLDVTARAVRNDPRLQSLNASVHLVDFAGMSITEQLALCRNTDVFVAAHGASMAWIYVVRKAVIELLPPVPEELYRCSNSWGRDRWTHSGGLTSIMGLAYVCLNAGSRTTRIIGKDKAGAL